MGGMADLWDKLFGGKFSKEPEVNKYLLQLNADIEGWITNYNRASDLLKEAHDKLDDDNARVALGAYCRWCLENGYDGNGLIHADDCILVKIRQELSRRQT